MLDSFPVQIGLWCGSALASAFAFHFMWRQKRVEAEREAEIPEYRYLQQRKAELEAQVPDLEERKRSALELIEAGEAAEQRLQLALARVHELEEKLAGLQAQREELERVSHGLAAAKEEQAQLRQEVNELREQQARLSSEIEFASSQLEEAKRLDQELRRGLDSLQAKKAELEHVEQHLARVRQELLRLSEAFDAQRSKRDALDRELAEKRAESAGLAKQIQAHEAHLKDLRAQQERLEKILAENSAKSGSGRSEDRYRDLWEPLNFAKLPALKTNPSEAKRLEEVSTYLEKLGLRFPLRVLYAFHTALKIADYSPLTVLAGISGTGKSELPRRYAEAMGIHFVGLAVQPRWDSPQDLFGFFNYIEGRYKATDLARAMVQFERYGRELWPLPKDWNHGREDRMLLVLLDEMNLARVEYYFSEFLSKLEVRRGIREEDESERAKAEIRIEMGSLAKDERPIALYPGRNVLFTGTMNEDESTQTLSDKVLDRACVLRFGRPKHPDSKPQGSKAEASTTGLSLSGWQSWHKKDLASADSDQVRQWISKLNDAMEELGRPFGHRVAQAIHAYVANYPESASSSGPNRVRIAFADQVEQRILPKLRGLELEGKERPRKAIREVLEACEDRLLLEAFNKGWENDQGFIWRGLDRSEG